MSLMSVHGYELCIKDTDKAKDTNYKDKDPDFVIKAKAKG